MRRSNGLFIALVETDKVRFIQRMGFIELHAAVNVQYQGRILQKRYYLQSSFTAYLLQLSKQSIRMAVLPFNDIQLSFINATSFLGSFNS